MIEKHHYDSNKPRITAKTRNYFKKLSSSEIVLRASSSSSRVEGGLSEANPPILSYEKKEGGFGVKDDTLIHPT